MRHSVISSIAALVFSCFSATAAATLITLDITWDGSPNNNSATATGHLIFDDSLLPDIVASDPSSLPHPGIVDFGITISGASSGNGTFGLSDFQGFYFWAPSTLNFSQELIGQTLAGGCSFGANDGSCGDFNVFRSGSSPSAPNAAWFFTLATSGGEEMNVTSMEATVPEPTTLALLGLGLAGLGFSRRRSI